jgi:hypothetical protein
MVLRETLQTFTHVQGGLALADKAKDVVAHDPSSPADQRPVHAGGREV